MPVIHCKSDKLSLRVGVVVSRFNEQITLPLLDCKLKMLAELKVSEQQIQIVWVPGAVEIPLAAQALAKTQKFDAVICLGAVIRGETEHFTYVCQQVSYGCQKVALEQETPVIFGVLTTDDEFQAEQRVGGTFGHKGIESADSAMEMALVHRAIKKL